MATYYITRKDSPLLTPRLLAYKAQAFRTLYSGILKSDPQLVIQVRGRWPDAYGGDGLFLEYSNALITDIGRKYVEVKYRDDMTGEYQAIRLELCPTNDTGFTEIMFMTDR